MYERTRHQTPMPAAGRYLLMNATQRETLRELLRRVDEVRGMSERSEPSSAIDPDDKIGRAHV